MRSVLAGLATIISFVLISFSGISQTATPKYKIELKLMTPEISLTSDRSNIVFVVTVTNLTNKPVQFGSTLHYGYKKYNDQDWYLEAVDQNNDKYDIDGDQDNELFFDDPEDTSRNMNKISMKIITGAYNFTPGKYKIRWVYDPFNNLKNSNPAQKTLPIYSNWEALNVTE